MEALCRGQCVIAPNFPTMNEYIVHNVNGYLYNMNKLEEIDLSNFGLIGKEARERAINGFNTWQQQKIKLIDYVNDFDNIKSKEKIYIFSKVFIFTVLELFLSIFKIHKLLILLINKVIKIIIRNS